MAGGKVGGAVVKIKWKGAKDLPSCSQQGICYREKVQMVCLLLGRVS